MLLRMTNARDTYTRTETWHLISASHAISFDAFVGVALCMYIRYTRSRNNFKIKMEEWTQDIDSGTNEHTQSNVQDTKNNLKIWNYSRIFQSLPFLRRENSSIYPLEIIIAIINKRRIIVARRTNYHKSPHHNGENEHSSAKKKPNWE